MPLMDLPVFCLKANNSVVWFGTFCTEMCIIRTAGQSKIVQAKGEEKETHDKAIAFWQSKMFPRSFPKWKPSNKPRPLL